VTLLHVADSQQEGEAFLNQWAGEHDLPDVRLRVETGDVGTAIETAARDASMVLVGVTERGLRSGLASESVPGDVVDRIDCSVLLAERARKRSLRERLVGSR